jgi:hypothetical protein
VEKLAGRTMYRGSQTLFIYDNGTRWQCCSAYDMIMNVQIDIQGI